VVEGVECLDNQLQSQVLSYGEVLRQRGVDIRESRTPQGIATDVAPGARRRTGEPPKLLLAVPGD
jgi:hypothetical protein